MLKSQYVAVDGFDGSGKTTLINEMRRNLTEAGKRVAVERLLPITVGLFKQFTRGTNDYMNIIPDRFRVTAYLWESYCRLILLNETYRNNDYIFFDRWIFTNLVSNIEWGEEADFIEFLIDSIPKPDTVLLVVTDPDIILCRLKAKNDWMLKSYSEKEIIRQAEQFYKGYMKQLEMRSIEYHIINGDGSKAAMVRQAQRCLDLRGIKGNE